MKKKNKSNRLDIELVLREMVPSKEAALPIIMSGSVLINGQVEYKASRLVKSTDDISIKIKNPYVSRGGLKIKDAFDRFAINISGLKIIDIGISTGGFSDFVLKNGAEVVKGIDVNIDQVDYNLRKNKKLSLLKKNAKDISKDDIEFIPDLIVMDLSFISITKIIPVLKIFNKVKILSLVKPQFEAPKHKVGKGGIISSLEDRIKIVLDVKKKIESNGFGIIDFTIAGIKGQKGNQEYFFLIEYGQNSINNDRIVAEMKNV